MIYQSPAIAVFQWKLDISLQDDYRAFIHSYLLSLGYKDSTKEQAVYQYFNLRKRQIEAKTRNVLYSREFVCPEEYKTALLEFEDKIRRGENLMPFQSEKIKQSAYNDMLLNDWGIQHFHLTRRFRNDGFAQRSQYQIFAYVTESTVYMIQIYPHNVYDLYSKREMVRILRDNWPEVTERFHIKDMVEMMEKFDDHSYGKVRDAHMLTMLELGKNEIYFPIGGGYSSSGHSTTAMIQADRVLNRLGAVQLAMRDNAEWIGKTINRIRHREEQYCDMKIRFLWIDDANKITMCETHSRLVVQFDGKEKWIRICEGYEAFM